LFDLGDNIFVAMNDILAVIDLATVRDSRDTRDFLRSALKSEPDFNSYKSAVILCTKNGRTKAMLSSASAAAIRSRLAQNDVSNFNLR